MTQAFAPSSDAERRLRHVVEHLREVFFETDVDGRWTFLNTAWTAVTGFSVGESLGRTFMEFLWADDIDLGEARFRPLVSGEREYSRYEVRFRTRNGSFRWIEVHAQAVIDDRTQIIGTSGTLRDVTAQRDLSEQLVRAREAAVAASHAKSDFLANMSHEIRTPMNGVIGLTELLLDTELSAEQRDYAEGVKQSAEALLTIINDILDFSKIEAGKLSITPVPHDFHQVIREAVNLVDVKARNKGLRVVLHLDPAVPRRVTGDPVRIRQVLINLIDNAVKFTHTGGVTVAVAPSEGEPTVQLSITDTGIGIDAQKLDAIFDKFTQADASTTRRYGGSGLGLAICKQLVELMRGTIGVTSDPGRGSTFWFRLPLLSLVSMTGVDDDARSESAIGGHSAAAPVRRARRQRVLVVEDNAINLKVACRMLEKLGCDVEVAENGAVAVEMVRKSVYDVVFMDCQMPVLDGYEATAAIRRLPEHGRTRIVAMTAHAMAADRDRCLASGMDDYISKPINAEGVRRVLEQCAEAARAGQGETADAGGDAALTRSFAADELWTRMDGDIKVIGDLVEMLAVDGPAYVTSLETAMAGGDAVTVACIAHTLKGTVILFGGHVAFELAKQIERVARDGSLANLGDLAGRLDAEVGRLVADLRRWVAALPAAAPVHKTTPRH